MTLATSRPRAWHVQFAREIRSVARLRHPAVVEVYDHGTVGPEAPDLGVGAPYLVMEWLGGGPLDEGPAARTWPGLRAALAALLGGLAHTHARGVCHLDLKPDNVLLGERGPVLTDFGLAVEAGAAIDRRGGLGSPGYMAPEQISDHAHLFGPTSDVYGLGCLAWALVTGHPPHAAPGVPAAGIAMGHLYAALPAFAPRFPVPAGLEPWLRRMLARAPALRFPCAADAAAALMAWTTPGHVDAEADTPRLPLPADWRAAVTRPERGDMLGVGRAMLSHRPPAPVGFEHVRDRLWGALAAVAHSGGVNRLCLAGPSGQGKSHLVEWLAEQALTWGRARVLRATHDDPQGIDCGLGPMLARAFGIAGPSRPGDPPDAERVGALLDLRLPRAASARTRARLLALVDPDGRAEVDGERIVLETTRDRHVAFGKLLRALGDDRPVLLIVEDLQWGSEARRMIEALSRARPAPPVLIVATVRTDVRPRPDRALGVFDDAEVVHLAPLDAAALRRLLARQLPLDPGLVEALVDRSAGSPLFAAEVLRHWVAADALVEGPNGYRLDPRAASALPAGMEGVWTARLESALGRLFADARDALEVGAVAGHVIEAGLWLEACGHAGVPWPAEALERLLDAGLVRELPGQRFRFVHAMLRESLLGWARRGGRWLAWNACCAEVYRRRAARGAPVDGLRFARHLLEAEEPAAALGPLATACRAALARREDHRAANLVGLRVRALRRLRMPRATPAWARLLLDSALIEQRRGHFSRARRRAWQTLRHPAVKVDAGLTCRALHLLGEIDHAVDGPRVAIRHVEQAMPYAERAGDRRLLIRQLALMGQNAMSLYRVSEAESALTRGLLLVEAGDEEFEGRLRHALAIAAALRGDIEGGLARIRRARAAFEAVASHRNAGATWLVEGDLSRRAGHLDRAGRCYGRYAEAHPDASGVDACNGALARGMLAVAGGRWADARRHLDAAAAEGLGLVAVSVAIGRLACLAGAGQWSAWDVAAEAFDRLFDDAPASTELEWAADRVARLALEAGQHRRADRARAWRAAHRQRIAAGDGRRSLA